MVSFDLNAKWCSFRNDKSPKWVLHYCKHELEICDLWRNFLGLQRAPLLDFCKCVVFLERLDLTWILASRRDCNIKCFEHVPQQYEKRATFLLTEEPRFWIGRPVDVASRGRPLCTSQNKGSCLQSTFYKLAMHALRSVILVVAARVLCACRDRHFRRISHVCIPR